MGCGYINITAILDAGNTKSHGSEKIAWCRKHEPD
jgi:hypothetical protein